MLQAIIFDMDGVLIDSHPVALAMMRECAERNAIPLDQDDYQAWLFMSARPFWTAMRQKHRLPHEIEFYLSDYNVEEEIRRYGQLQPIAGVAGLIERIFMAGIRLGVATSASRRRATAVINSFGWEPYLTSIVGADDVARHKPHGDVYVEAARRLNAAPAACIAIEDTDSGVEAARSAGLHVVGYNGPGSAGQRLTAADQIIDDFSCLAVSDLIALRQQ